MNCFYIHNIKSLSLGTPNRLLNNLGWARNLQIQTAETSIIVTMFATDPHSLLLLPGEALDAPTSAPQAEPTSALPAEPTSAPQA